MNTNLSKLNKKLICVTIGDIKGIGIHLLLKEFKKEKINNFVLLTNINIFNKYIKFPKNRINILNEENFNNYNKNKLNILSFKTLKCKSMCEGKLDLRETFRNSFTNCVSYYSLVCLRNDGRCRVS